MAIFLRLRPFTLVWRPAGNYNMAMKIQLNGAPHTVEQPVTVAQLLQQLGLAQKRVAVEVNLEIVPRSSHAAHELQANDKVEVVHAIGGG